MSDTVVLVTQTNAPCAPSIERLERAWLSIIRLAERPALDEYLRRASGVDLSRPAYAALARLHDAGPTQISDLAAAANIDISTMSRTLKHLLERGLLDRQPGTDRRSALMDASPRGKELVKRRRAAGQRFLEGILHQWSDADREALSALMGRLETDFAAFFDSLSTSTAAFSPSEPT